MVTPLPPTVLLHGDFSMPAQIPEARLIPFIPIPLQPEPCVPTAFLRQPLSIECLMDDVAAEIHMDPLEFRRKNLIQGYYEDAYLKPIAANTNGIFQCLEKGAEYIHWEVI
mgnify:CR=1 FL=1